MKESIVIGLVGALRAGKSTCASIFEADHGAVVFRNSASIEIVLDSLALERSRDNYIRIGLSLFQAFGKEVFARYFLEAVFSEASQRKYVVDGIRFPEEVQYYRERCKFVLIGVSASHEVRYLRAKSAADAIKDQELTEEYFRRQSQQSTELDVPGMVRSADVLIDNNGSFEQLVQAIADASAKL